MDKNPVSKRIASVTEIRPRLAKYPRPYDDEHTNTQLLCINIAIKSRILASKYRLTI